MGGESEAKRIQERLSSISNMYLYENVFTQPNTMDNACNKY